MVSSPVLHFRCSWPTCDQDDFIRPLRAVHHLLPCDGNNRSGDLDLLHSFVTSLEPVSNMSAALAKMQRLFRVLYNVALKYVEIKTSRDQQSVGREFDMYLNALGLGPGMGMDMGMGEGVFGDMHMQHNMGFQGMHSATEQGALMGGKRLVVPVEGSGMPQQGMRLRDWYYSNQQTMGLLEENSL
jgi:hypothetical protein